MDRQAELFEQALGECGSAIDRLALGYEADPDRRRDLRQEIHFHLWRSLAAYDRRCSLRTWVFRVAHNVAASHVHREHRNSGLLQSLDAVEPATDHSVDLDRERALERLTELIRRLKPLERQIMLCYLEEMDAASIAEVVGLSPAHVAVKIHRIKTVLAKQFPRERQHA